MKRTLSLFILILFSFVGNAQQDAYPKVISIPSGVRINATNVSTWLGQYFKSGSQTDFIIVKQFSDDLGFIHYRLQQRYRGIPIEFSALTAHEKNGRIQSVSGDFFPVYNVNVQPALSENQAFQRALHYVGAKKYLWEIPEEAHMMNYSFPRGKLVILPDFKNKDSKSFEGARLAFKFDIYAVDPVRRSYIYVDAHNGKILYEDKIIKHAVATGTADTRYSGQRSIKTDSYNGSYRLRDYSRGNGIETYNMHQGTNYSQATDFVDNDNYWSASEYDNADKDNAALDAHWGAQMTYDYWKNVHNRNSYDGNGAKIKSYVHYDRDYDNAFWNGSVMTYGDGSGTYFDALTSLDVAAHEIGHAVCEHTANLTYSYESGALNEGFSDIWGACVEYFADPNKQTWLIGEDIERRSGHQALRSMSDPKSEGQPDTYQGQNWYSGSGDNGGVHTNSGVLNHWFYLLTVGGSGTNDNNDNYNVTGIGITKAAKIAFRAESVYMTSSTNYADARTYTIQAAKDLYGAGSQEEQSVTNAWYAVGVGAPYGSPSSYCSSKGNSVADEYIQRVQLNTIDNSSTGGGGYSDFTNISTDLSLGGTYTITITPKWTGTVYSEAYAVWIDYNGDGDFEDSGELVWSLSPTKNSPVSGTFTVPSSATEGSTRMRVSMKYNGIPGPCETFSYGEVEDYTVNLIAGSGGNTGSCDVTVTSFPYHQGFENTFGSWTQDTNDDFDWTLKSGSTPSSGTGPSGAAEGTYYIYVESSSPNYSYKRTILNSPCFDLSGMVSATISFKYHMYGDASKMGSLKLELSTDNGQSWTTVWSKSGNQGNAWYTANVDVSSYAGQVVKLRFNGLTGSTWKGDMAVDAFNFNASATQNTCTDIQLRLTFDNYPEETSWKLFDANGNVVSQGGTYGNEPDGSTIYINGCLDAGCYTFTIYDVYGDGMCCGYGNGSYELKKVSDGTILASGGSFGSSESTDFCLNANGITFSNPNDSNITIPDLQVSPVPADRLLQVIMRDKKMKNYKIFDMSGKLVLEGQFDDNIIHVENLQSGVYMLQLSSEKKTLQTKIIIR